MKRKDEAEERKQVEKETQKSVERTHWTLEDEKPTNNSNSKLKFIIEYDNIGGINGTVRQSFKNFNKEPETEESNTGAKTSSKTTTNTAGGPMNKIPKLSENKKKN